MSFSVRPLEFETRGLTLRGSAYVPSGGRSFATAILLHGFGGQRTEASRAFVQLARALVAENVAVVAMDRAGHGESDGEFADTVVSQDVADSLEVLRWIAGVDFVDAANLHLVGISMGAVIASVVAAETDLTIRSLTMWSVAALFVDELRSGMLQGRTTNDVDVVGYFDFHGQRVGPAFFADACRLDVYGRARGFEGPVRVLHGGRDFIPASYAERYADIYGDAMEYSLVPGADHCWETVPERDFVLGETVRFVASHTRRRCPT